jgi:serine/threonine-protein kinase
LEEARAMARIRHPNVVQVYAFGEHGDARYVAMEFIKGASLEHITTEHQARREPLSIHSALSVLREVIDGVSAIHDAGLLHCDLKPANIVVEEDTGRAVVIDFGVAVKARSAHAMPLAGSPAYMAPEQADDDGDSGSKLSEQSDIYALGVTAFEILTGALPYMARGYAQMMAAHRDAAIPRMSSLRPELAPFDALVCRALAKHPAERFTSCAEMKVALEEARALWAQGPRMDSEVPSSAPTADEVRVLVVDDDSLFRSAAARAAKLAFSDKIIRVLPASSGEQAVSIAARRMPNVILLDYMLPNLDGVATLSAIRSLPSGHDARVVVISGSVDEVRWRFAALGVKDFLPKPVDLDQLIGTLQAIVQRSFRTMVPTPPG